MYYKISDFVSEFDSETAATLKIFNNLSDKSLDQKVTEKGRSLGRLAWHIANTFGEMGSAAGLHVYSIDDKSIPSSAKTIADEYSKSAASLKAAVLKEWNDDSLKDVRTNLDQKPNPLSLDGSPDASQGTNDCPYAPGWIKSTRHLWSRTGGMGKYGHAPAGIIC